MRLIRFFLALTFLTGLAQAQIAPPQINLSGNVGCQGFPCLNSGTIIFTSDANHTLTAQESSATGGIKITSGVSLTATRNLVLPTAFGKLQFVSIENATTGGQSIQIIGQSGTGITIPNGQTAAGVWFDGTNVTAGSVGGGSISGQTAGYAIEAETATTATGPFPMDDSVTTAATVTVHKSFAVNDGSGVGGGFKSATEGTIPTAGSGYETFWADSATHRWEFNPNNVGNLFMVGIATAGTANNCPKFAANGIDLVDSGSTCGGGGSLPSGAVGQMITNTTGSTTYAPQPAVLWQQSADTVASVNSACSSACLYHLTSTMAVTASAAFNANVYVAMDAQGLFNISSAQTLTFTNTPQGIIAQHFGGAGAVAGLSGPVPAEWFGAVGFGTKSAAGSGSDYSANFQSAINAITGSGWVQLQSLCYNITAGVSITHSGVGIHGTTGRDQFFSGVNTSCLVQTSALGVVITVQGPSSGSPIVWNSFEKFSLEHLTQPTGTTPSASTGMFLQYAGGASLDEITANDFLDGFHFNGTPAFGLINDSDSCNNGALGVNSYVSGQVINCFDIDSENGAAMDTFFANVESIFTTNSAVCSAGVISTGINIHGAAINDIDLNYPNAAGLTCYDVKITYDGSGGPDSEADIHIDHPIGEGSDAVVQVNNLASLTGYPTVSIADGYVTGIGSSSKVIDCENSIGVQVVGNQTVVADGDWIYANGCSGLLASANKADNVGGIGIHIIGTIGSNFTGNNCTGCTTTFFSASSSSTANTIVGNNDNGTGSVGYTYDGTSTTNDDVGNTCGAGITSCRTGSAPVGTGSGGSIVGGGYAQVFSQSSGVGGRNSVGIGILPTGAAGTVPCFTLNIVGSQGGITCNTYYNGANWVYVAGTGAPGSYTAGKMLLQNGANGETLQLSLDPYGATGGTISGSDTTDVALWGQYGATGHQFWINPQANNPSFPTNAVFALNPSANWWVDFSGNQNQASGTVLGWNGDTGLSRDSADAVDCGNGTAGDKTCTFNAATGNFTTAVTTANVTDSALTAGTSPICPNGVGGAFTTTGCSGGSIGGTATNNVYAIGTGTSTIGPGTISNVSGTDTDTNPFAAPSLISGTPSSAAKAALPSGAHGVAGDESSTAGVPAAGVDYIRWDATAHCAELSLNGGAEACIGGGGGVANTTITIGSGVLFGSNECWNYSGSSGSSTTTMTGVTTGMTFVHTPTSDVSGVTGWSPGATGQLYFISWPTANTLNDYVCNPTSSTITTGSSVTFNVSAK